MTYDPKVIDKFTRCKELTNKLKIWRLKSNYAKLLMSTQFTTITRKDYPLNI